MANPYQFPQQNLYPANQYPPQPQPSYDQQAYQRFYPQPQQYPPQQWPPQTAPSPAPISNGNQYNPNSERFPAYKRHKTNQSWSGQPVQHNYGQPAAPYQPPPVPQPYQVAPQSWAPPPMPMPAWPTPAPVQTSPFAPPPVQLYHPPHQTYQHPVPAPAPAPAPPSNVWHKPGYVPPVPGKPKHRFAPYSNQLSSASPTTAPVAAHLPPAIPTPPPRHVKSQAGSDYAKSQVDVEERDDCFDWDVVEALVDNEPINPDLSLGEIVWHPPKSVSRPLPGHFDLAEANGEQFFTAIRGNGGKSISIHATDENMAEQCRSVRETRRWKIMKEDPVFCFPSGNTSVVSIKSLLGDRVKSVVDDDEMEIEDDDEQYEPEDIIPVSSLAKPQNEAQPPNVPMKSVVSTKLDDEDDDEPYSPPPINEPIRRMISQPLPSISPAIDSEPVIDQEGNHKDKTKKVAFDEPSMQLKTEAAESAFTQTLSATTPAFEPENKKTQSTAKPIPEIKVAQSVEEQKQPQSKPALNKRLKHALPPKPPKFMAVSDQEDILASLGVTGPAKPAFITPGPAYRSPGGTRTRSESPVKEMQEEPSIIPAPLASINNVYQFPTLLPPPPPPPPPASEAPQQGKSADPWAAAFGHDGVRDSPGSEAGTAVGSDFHDETDSDWDAGPAKPKIVSSKKSAIVSDPNAVQATTSKELKPTLPTTQDPEGKKAIVKKPLMPWGNGLKVSKVVTYKKSPVKIEKPKAQKPAIVGDHMQTLKSYKKEPAISEDSKHALKLNKRNPATTEVPKKDMGTNELSKNNAATSESSKINNITSQSSKKDDNSSEGPKETPASKLRKMFISSPKPVEGDTLKLRLKKPLTTTASVQQEKPAIKVVKNAVKEKPVESENVVAASENIAEPQDSVKKQSSLKRKSKSVDTTPKKHARIQSPRTEDPADVSTLQDRLIAKPVDESPEMMVSMSAAAKQVKQPAKQSVKSPAKKLRHESIKQLSKNSNEDADDQRLLSAETPTSSKCAPIATKREGTTPSLKKASEKSNTSEIVPTPDEKNGSLKRSRKQIEDETESEDEASADDMYTRLRDRRSRTSTKPRRW